MIPTINKPVSIRQRIVFLVAAAFLSFFGWGVLALALSPILVSVAFLSWFLFAGAAVLMLCPACGNPVLRRSVRLLGLRLDYWGPIPPRRCDRCGTSFTEPAGSDAGGQGLRSRVDRFGTALIAITSVGNFVMAARFYVQRDRQMAALSGLAGVLACLLVLRLLRFRRRAHPY